ncbi:MAG TPA: hypothetical protein VLJ39_00095, partial [Tepidisphaeraceae bacterium]|nr:hypothetical protein [Tepidisphaeraceae bacterium]
NNQMDSDFIWWENDRDINQSQFTRYLGNPQTFNLAVMRCPSDDFTFRTKTGKGGYHFSYVQNGFMSCVRGSGISPTQDVAQKISQVRRTADKVLMYEEELDTIDDGHATPQNNASINLLAIRHDPTRKLPETQATGMILNPQCRGNAVFCDGHAEYITRTTLHDPQTYDPVK